MRYANVQVFLGWRWMLFQVVSPLQRSIDLRCRAKEARCLILPLAPPNSTAAHHRDFQPTPANLPVDLYLASMFQT